MIEMLARQKAAQATVDRFRGVPFAYGKNDCVRLAAFALRQRGHRPQLGKAGSYQSPAGAVRALKRSGFATLSDALDALGLKRLPPASVLPGDIVMVPGEEPFGGSLAVAIGNGRVLGYHQDCVGAEILHPLEFIAAWSV